LLDRRNASGRPLAGSAWLDAHHRAKLPERQAFSERLAELAPSSVLDLGCANGLWLDVLDKVLPDECPFIGLDSDESSLLEARDRARSWARKAHFVHADLEDPDSAIPEADLTLLFNVSSYLANLDSLLALVAARSGHAAVRQYDGAALRFGPMDADDRAMIEQSLRASVAGSGQFRHYDLDRVFTAIQRAPFQKRDVTFELFARSSPFPAEFVDYYEGMLDWTRDYLSDAAGERLRSWRAARDSDPAAPGYFVEVDFVAVLS
jgi:SAM-dependent methyltransferase